jgi:hypothetical protein
MESNKNKTMKWKQVALVGGLALVAITILVIRFETKNTASAQGTQMTFQSPAEAGAELAKVAKSGDEAALANILGVDAKARLINGDPEADKTAMAAFAAKYEKMNRWVEMNDGSRVLYVGVDNFAFPVPLAKNSSGQWYFDEVAGAQEIRARDIGRNELLAIDACSAIANAQELYFLEEAYPQNMRSGSSALRANRTGSIGLCLKPSLRVRSEISASSRNLRWVRILRKSRLSSMDTPCAF